MIIKHGAFVCGDPGYIARGYMAFIVIVLCSSFHGGEITQKRVCFSVEATG